MNEEVIYNEKGAFLIIGDTISQGFSQFNRYSNARRYEFLEFLKSKVVQAWCDCSTNFEQQKLISYYKKLLDSNKKKYEVYSLRNNL